MDRVSRVNLFFFSCLSLVINLALITMSLITAMGLGLNHIPRSHARGTVSIYLFIYFTMLVNQAVTCHIIFLRRRIELSAEHVSLLTTHNFPFIW